MQIVTNFLIYSFSFHSPYSFARVIQEGKSVQPRSLEFDVELVLSYLDITPCSALGLATFEI